jgi:glycogen synthase
MRIAYISYEYPPDTAVGGIATYVYQISKVMAARGHDVEVFSASPHRSDSAVSKLGIAEHRILTQGRGEFPALAGERFATRHHELPFDVVEGPDFSADAHKAIELVPDVPLILRMHTPSIVVCRINNDADIYGRRDHLSPYRIDKLVRRLFQQRDKGQSSTICDERGNEIFRFERIHATKARLVVSPSEDLAKFAKEEWNISPARIKTLAYPYVPSSMLTDIPILSRCETVGFVGRLERRKGIETIARAIPLVLEKRPFTRFRLVGAADATPDGGNYKDWIVQKLAGYMRNVDIIGSVPYANIAEEYKRMDVCVFPSLWENFPNVCLEAMAAGRAVIGSSSGGMREMIQHGKSGLLVKPDDHKSLSRQILRLLNNPAEAERLGRAAREKILRDYSADVIGKATESLYRTAIGEHPSLNSTVRCG